MSHLDDGLLTALVDNELDEAERRNAESHLAECGECRRLLEEIRTFATEADALVTAVELPPRRVPEGAPTVAGDPGAVPPPASSRRADRRVPWRALAWAASVVLAAGLGWMASDLHYAGGAPELSDRAAKTNRLAPAVEEPKPAAPTPAQAPGPLAGGRPAEQDLREVQSTGSLDRGNNAPDRRLATPPAAARDEAVRAAEKPQSRADQTGLAQLGNAAAPAAAPAISSVGEVAAKALQSSPSERSAKRRAGFRQVEMEEAVRTLAGSIRLVDGLQPVRILLGPPPIGTEADSTSDLIRVVYLDHPGREFWLDQQRAVAEEPASGARYRAGLLAGDTVFSQLAEGSASLRWVDQTGFRLALTGFMSADSLRALMGRVH